MGKRIFLIFLILIIIGSAILLNQYAPVPISTIPSIISVNDGLENNDAIPQTAKTITITSLPSQATIFLDGKDVGKTPLTLAQLTDPRYSLRAEKDGYKVYSATLVPSESNGLLQITLTSSLHTTEDTGTSDTISIHDDNNITALFNDDPQIPDQLLGIVTVPQGFRFPLTSTDITQRINLEVIPPALTTPLTGIIRSELIARLATLYYYDPQTLGINLDNTFTPNNIVLFDGASYDPARNKISSGETTVWYNHSATTCQLRTDPQSPLKINQLLPAGKAFPLVLTEKGIYIFYCQGQPGPTHTLVIS